MFSGPTPWSICPLNVLSPLSGLNHQILRNLGIAGWSLKIALCRWFCLVGAGSRKRFCISLCWRGLWSWLIRWIWIGWPGSGMLIWYCLWSFYWWPAFLWCICCKRSRRLVRCAPLWSLHWKQRCQIFCCYGRVLARSLGCVLYVTNTGWNSASLLLDG